MNRSPSIEQFITSKILPAISGLLDVETSSKTAASPAAAAAPVLAVPVPSTGGESHEHMVVEQQQQLTKMMYKHLQLQETKASSASSSSGGGGGGGDDEDERASATRVFKTVIKMIVHRQYPCMQPFSASYAALLPYLCRFYPSTQHNSTGSTDEELDHDTRLSMACIAQSLLTDRTQLSLLVDQMETVAASQSWHQRLCILPYIQVLAFMNLFLVHKQPKLVERIQNVVLALLQDERYEVSQMAGITFSGLIQCGLIAIDDKLMATVDALCGGRLRKKKKRRHQQPQHQQRREEDAAESNSYTAALHRRHAGVLVLTSCVLSSPYTVPAWMPRVVMRLSEHLHEPQPIQTTVKEAFSNFRRTHHDNWHEDKFKFTSDELVVLTDLLVSPNYYA